MRSIVKQVIELQYTIIYDDCTKFIDYMSGDNYAKANEPFLLARVKLDVAYSVGIRDYETAFEWKYKAVEVYVEIFGADHPDTAIMYNNISVNCIELGELELALQYAELAYPVLKKTFGADNFKTKSTSDTIKQIKNLLKLNK